MRKSYRVRIFLKDAQVYESVVLAKAKNNAVANIMATKFKGDFDKVEVKQVQVIYTEVD